MIINYANTQMYRKVVSAPTRFIAENAYLEGFTVLNFGSGRAFADTDVLHTVSAGCQAYDPFSPRPWEQIPPNVADVVVATYVLNVLPPVIREHVLQEILAKTKHYALITVRTDKIRGDEWADGVLTSKNTFQKYYTEQSFKEEFAAYNPYYWHRGPGFLTFIIWK